MQTDQDKHTKETNKIAKSEKIVWRRHAKEQNTPTRNIANKFDVPVTQVLPVHPVEHWHLLGETQAKIHDCYHILGNRLLFQYGTRVNESKHE